MLRQGFAATTVDDICSTAGVTKGSFFHYFKNKDEICFAAMDAWSAAWVGILEAGNFKDIHDPLDRVKRLFEVMEAAYLSTEVDPGCVVGTVAQERSLSSESLRAACEKHLEDWVRFTTGLLCDAKALHAPASNFDPTELAWWLCTFVQGTMLIIKTQTDRNLVKSNIRHCRAYVLSFFPNP